MDAIISALKEERKQINLLISRYQKELKQLPRGAFFVRNIRDHFYGYVTYSEKGLIKQKYIGVLSPDVIRSHREKFQNKKKIERLLRQAKDHKLFLERAVKNAGKKGKRRS